ncbi:MAG TPA: ABC transporter permease [Candidatus Saccharimonadales bacterium]|jgi:ABC-2 type transport system permease protein
MDKLRTSLFTVLVFTRLNTRRFFRDRLAIFFGILFPLIFLFVFGGISGGNSSPNFQVAVINQSQSEFSKQFVKDLAKSQVIKIDEAVTSQVEATDRMGKGQLDATITLPKDFGQTTLCGASAGAAEGRRSECPTGKAVVSYTQNNAQAGQGLSTALQGQFAKLNQQFTGVNPPLSVETKQTNQKSLTPFDYTFAGLLGFAIVGMGIFGPINVFPELKKQGILRRLHTTPLKVWQYFLSTMIAQAIIGLVSLAVMFVVAVLIFDLNVIGNYLEIVLFLVFSIITILGIGLAIGGWAKNERQAAPLSNIVVFPMLFLSGTFFPRFAMPEWLQNVSTFLPLTPVIDGIRLLTTQGAHLTDIGAQLGLMALWTIVIYAVAFRVFRWE